MSSPLPLLIFDGECDFCRACVEIAKRLTAERVHYAPFQDVADQFPQIPRADFESFIQFIASNGKNYRAAHAVYQTLAYAPGYRWLVWSYEHVPGFARISETAYQFVAIHRHFFSRWIHE